MGIPGVLGRWGCEGRERAVEGRGEGRWGGEGWKSMECGRQKETERGSELGGGGGGV